MEQLGVNFIYLTAQIVNFGIVLFLLQRFLYKPVLKVLDERRKRIESGIEYSKKMKQELEKINVKEEKVISDAKRESQKIIEEARLSAEKVEKEMIRKARKEAEEIIQQAKSVIDEERKKALQDVEKQAAELVAAGTKRVLEGSLSEELQHEIIKQSIEDLKHGNKFKLD